jgi:hypothetical protein
MDITSFTSDRKSLGLILVFVMASCGQGVSQRTADPISRVDSGANATRSADNETYIPDQFGERIGEFIKEYTNEDHLSIMDYEVTKKKRLKKVDGQRATEIEYATLRQRQKVVAKFDSELDGLTKVRFGVFSFLNQNEKQLVVEQTSSKFWRYWIVSLRPTVRILYDSGKYDIVYELRVADFDRDGYFEIIQNVGTFWYFDSLDNLYSPRPEIISKYDNSTGRYEPANPYFSEVTLKDVTERINKTHEAIERKDDLAYNLHIRSAVLDVVIRHLYSGKAKEGWDFYNQNYKIEDREALRSEIIARMRKDKLYREIERTARDKP